MRPTISPGSLVFVHHVPISSLKVGDVITYTNPLYPSTTLSHRIIKRILIDGTVPGFITKGDANKVADVPIAGGAVEGRVVGHVPHAGYWLLDIKKPIVMLPIVYLVALLTMIEEAKRLAAYYRTQTPYRLEGYSPQLSPAKSFTRLYMGISLFLGVILTLSYFGPQAAAALKSNIVTLTNDRITVAATNTSQCSGNINSNTSVTIIILISLPRLPTVNHIRNGVKQIF
jgi:signal peptidase I